MGIISTNFFGISNRKASDRKKIIRSSINLSVSEDYKNFGYDYFDNPKHIGYQGYKYDGRYSEAVKKLINYYKLKPGSKILELGCAKGYVLIEFLKQKMSVTGLDISKYALKNCHPDLKSFLVYGSASILPFKNNYFDLVLIKDMLPHLPFNKIELAIKECNRVTNKYCFFEIESGLTEKDLKCMNLWDPTHLICKTPEWWVNLLNKINYIGDIHFKFPWTEEE